ncbi:MAG: hypothetical protein ACOCUI_00480 [bacterium]
MKLIDKNKYSERVVKDPNLFIRDSFRIIPFYKAKYIGIYFLLHTKGSGVKARVGLLKKNKKERVQSILIPYKGNEKEKEKVLRNRYKLKDSF